jgi:tripartite-type tricarboxylate transporter receptor subunit TctC
LNAEVVRALNTADVKERFLKTGSEVVGSTPGELAAAIKADMMRMSKVIKDAGIRAD